MRANADLLEITVNSMVDVFFAQAPYLASELFRFGSCAALALARQRTSHERRAVAAA